jgi:hypothetical protein
MPDRDRALIQPLERAESKSLKRRPGALAGAGGAVARQAALRQGFAPRCGAPQECAAAHGTFPAAGPVVAGILLY